MKPCSTKRLDLGGKDGEHALAGRREATFLLRDLGHHLRVSQVLANDADDDTDRPGASVLFQSRPLSRSLVRQDRNTGGDPRLAQRGFDNLGLNIEIHVEVEPTNRRRTTRSQPTAHAEGSDMETQAETWR